MISFEAAVSNIADGPKFERADSFEVEKPSVEKTSGSADDGETVVSSSEENGSEGEKVGSDDEGDAKAAAKEGNENDIKQKEAREKAVKKAKEESVPTLNTR